MKNHTKNLKNLFHKALIKIYLNITSRIYFDNYYYKDQTCRKLEHLSTLDLNLREKTVLDIGAGAGDYTQFFTDRRCFVTAIDARIEHVKYMRARFKDNPLVEVHQINIEKYPVLDKTYNIILLYGMLYLVKDPLKLLSYLDNYFSELLLIETRICENALLSKHKKEYHTPDSSLDGKMLYYSRKELYLLLKSVFKYVYIPNTQPNHSEFPINWKQAKVQHETQKAIFIVSRKPLKNRRLSADLLIRQSHCS